MTPLGDGARVLAFRRRQVAVSPRRAATAGALLRGFLGAVVIVALPVAGVAWVFTSPRFALSQLEIEGTQRVPASWIRAALQPLRGENLLALSLLQVHQRLAAHPWVAAVEIEKRLPDALAVRVAERHPRALLRVGEELFFVDDEARLIAPYDPRLGAADLPLLSAREPSRVAGALAVAGRLEGLDLPWTGGISEVEALAEDDYELRAAGLDFAVLASGQRLEAGLQDLGRWAPVLEQSYGPLDTVDVRFADRILIQPVVDGERAPGAAAAAGASRPSPSPRQER